MAPGINGVVNLAAVGKYQRAHDLRPRQRRAYPGPGRAGDRPRDHRCDRDAVSEHAGDRRRYPARRRAPGRVLLQTARAKINYRGGRGTAQLVANGRSARTPSASPPMPSSRPTSTASPRRASSAQWPFRLAQPATIRDDGGTYALLPVAIVVPQGQVRVAGRYGSGAGTRSRGSTISTSPSSTAFAAGAGIGGRATGSLDFVAGRVAAFPRADLRLDIRQLHPLRRRDRLDAGRHRGARARSAPKAARSAALIQRGGATIGRAQIRLQPVGGGAWSTRSPMRRLAAASATTARPMCCGAWPASPTSSYRARSASPPTSPAPSGSRATDRRDPRQRAAYDNETYGTRISAIRADRPFHQ